MGIFVVSILLLLILVGIIIAAIITKDVFWVMVAVIYGAFCVLILLNEIKIMKKESGQKVKSKINYTAIIVYLAIASIFIVLCYALYQNQKMIKNSVKTEATVYNIEIKYDEDNAHNLKNKRCFVYYNYNVGETEYKAVKESCKYAIGDECTIFYNKANPTKISQNRILVLLLGILLSLIVLIIYLFQELKPVNIEDHGDIKVKKIKLKKNKKMKK